MEKRDTYRSMDWKWFTECECGEKVVLTMNADNLRLYYECHNCGASNVKKFTGEIVLGVKDSQGNMYFYESGDTK